MKLNLIREKSNQTNLVCLNEFEKSLESKFPNGLNVIYSNKNKFKNLILKLLLFTRVLVKNNNNSLSLTILMGPYFGGLIPYVFLFGKNYLFLFDAWPKYHHRIAKTANLFNIKTIFFSSRQATILFNKTNYGIKGVWVPEGVFSKDYNFNDYNDKKIDVLEFGRKFDLYHEKIRVSLEMSGYIHYYAKKEGTVIFETHKSFVDALANSKISICIPTNISHPLIAEGISTMTQRYLQSMSSKCLIVGIMPDEMLELFDYCPIINIDFENADLQIINILQNYEAYILLIEKNYLEVLKNHQWENRISNICNEINAS